MLRKRREHRGQLADEIVVRRPQDSRLERPQVVVEGVDDQPERNVALELRRAPIENQIAVILAPAAQLSQQSRLADPRLTKDLHEPGLPGR